MSGERRSLRAGVRHLAGRLLPARVRARRAERRRRERIARKRAELLASDPALRAFEHGGAALIGRRVDRFTAPEAAEANLRLVVETAEAAGLDYFLIPGVSPLRHVVGLRRADKKPFLSAVRERHGATELYAGRPGEADDLAAGPALYAEGALPHHVKAPQAMRFGRFLLGPDDQLIAGLEYGCDVEFWALGDKLAEDPALERKLERVRVKVPGSMLYGSWIAPRPNRVADILPPEAREAASRVIGERKYATFEPFNRRLVDDVDFPIDAVYMWVDGEDPEWAARRARHLHGDSADHTHLTGASRYISRDELKYSLRSLHAFAPFIRNVYIVTAGQTPAWLDTAAPGVRVVDHAEIFADPSVLPVFSSHAIATQLHRIPGLSDHYLVLNDDVFFGRPSQAGQFFFPNGVARLPFSPLQIGLGATRAEDSAPNSAGKNVRKLLEAEFGRFITSKFKHLPHPQLRRVAFEMEERYAAPVEATTRSRFRDPADIEFAAMLHHHYAMLTGRAVPGTLKLRYVDISHDDAGERLDALAAGRDAEFFCLNDVDTPPEREEEINGMIRGFLDHYLPFPSPYERT